eukprot:GHUV01045715.1.p1 GENE.GHUV01045715.1~~GHUV01045715.1.p1  ORF type:complete len:127 (-),score=6.50 GHUV01045715.1:274-654(-)
MCKLLCIEGSAVGLAGVFSVVALYAFTQYNINSSAKTPPAITLLCHQQPSQQQDHTDCSSTYPRRLVHSCCSQSKLYKPPSQVPPVPAHEVATAPVMDHCEAPGSHRSPDTSPLEPGYSSTYRCTM